ncbi:MAG: glycosyltransferase family 2 protein [Rhodobacteraceae bacterium]|nr:glycosyltransferase family 2 protein [Paracoccaceae bacterium]
MTETQISAIIPCYNTRDCIVPAINSALAQIDVGIEVIVIDDASTDGTADIVEKTFQSEPRVKLLRQSVNQGPSAARNRGLDAATGEWIGLLDSDDLWLPDRSKRLLEHADQADFIADNLMGYDVSAAAESGPVYQDLSDRQLTLSDFLLPRAWDQHDFGYLQPLLRRSFVDSHDIRYRTQVRAGEDLLFNIEFMLAGGRAFYVDWPGYIYATPVGAISRAASPFSRSSYDTRPLMDALQALFDASRCNLRQEERSAFETRLDDLRAQAPIGAFHRARAQRNYIKLLNLVLGESAVRRKILETLCSRTTKN